MSEPHVSRHGPLLGDRTVGYLTRVDVSADFDLERMEIPMTDTTTPAGAALDVLEAAIRAAARARYVARWPDADEQHIARYVTDMAANSTYRVEILAGFAEVFAAGRAQAAADIRARLAEDIAEGDDVSSGEAIWEQGGFRQGLKTAAGVAEEGRTP